MASSNLLSRRADRIASLRRDDSISFAWSLTLAEGGIERGYIERGYCGDILRGDIFRREDSISFAWSLTGGVLRRGYIERGYIERGYIERGYIE